MATDDQKPLVWGTDTFILINLVRMMAESKGLEYDEGNERAFSKPFATFDLDEKLSARLQEGGFEWQNRPDCNNAVRTLVDTNPQSPRPGFGPSNYWNFELLPGETNRYDLRIKLSVGFEMNDRARGFVLRPFASGTFLSPADHLPNFRMFKALVSSRGELPLVAITLASSDGSITATWSDLGLGGIRSLSTLFREFAGGNDTIQQLARRSLVFNPAPCATDASDEIFVTEPAQPRLFQRWQDQLQGYREKLSA